MIAVELNKYFTSISEILDKNAIKTPDIAINKLLCFTNSKLPGDTFFPYSPNNSWSSNIIHK